MGFWHPLRSLTKARPRSRGRRGRSASKPPHQKQRGLRMERFEQRVLLAISLRAGSNEITQNEVLSVAPREFTIVFDPGTVIDAELLNSITFTRSGGDGTFGNANDVVLDDRFVGMSGGPSNEVAVRFAENLPDDHYRVGVNGQTFNFELDLAPQVVAVVPQPTRAGPAGITQEANKIVVYFNDDDLNVASATNPDFYQLLFTNGTADPSDDGAAIKPQSVAYDPVTDTATLTFAASLNNRAVFPAGVYRLRIGTDEAPLAAPLFTVAAAGETGSSFASAYDLFNGTSLSTPRSHVVSAEIEPQPYTLEWFGGNDEPGHRNIPLPGETHVNAGPDLSGGVSHFEYNFRDIYGFVNNVPQHNQITENQKQRAREVFEFYSRVLGVEFVETPLSGITVATGDLRVVAPQIPTGPGGVAGISGGGIVVMDNAEDWGNSEFGGGWFRVAMHEIGHELGLGHALDLPPLTIMGGAETLDYGGPAEPVFPGDHDIVNAQWLHRPDVKDIDMYRVVLAQGGTLIAETVAERLANMSQLDSVITVFQEFADGTRRVIARNDDYYSYDSHVRLELGEGTYYIAVTSTGNIDFDPTIEDSGIGGTSQGRYELRVDFTPNLPVTRSIRDADGTPTPLDGNLDGKPGGVFNHWFTLGDVTYFVDGARGVAGNGSLTTPYHTVSAALTAASAYTQANPGQHAVVRIVGDTGALDALTNARTYLIGTNIDGTALEDGRRMEIPKNTTVMIDGGAIFKIRDASIDVGSSIEGVDRSGGALQVLGTPFKPVRFTSALDETLGQDAKPELTTVANPGDWGGIIFRNDVDNIQRQVEPGRVDYEGEGIFLNYVSHAQMRYGGGEVVVNSVRQTIAPIEMIEARPTVLFNRLTRNAGAAMAADPRSFEESRFYANAAVGGYTADYDRVGPHIRGNFLDENSINALFIKVSTPSLPGVTKQMDVAGRWDDADIVHFVGENLQIAGTPGGPRVNPDTFQLEARLDGRLAIDPDVVVKLNGTRIETGIGGTLIAEGYQGTEVVFTALADDSYGRGGTFDTNGDGTLTAPAAGQWGGLFLGHLSRASIDRARIYYGGGATTIEGTTDTFNAVEIHQAQVRLTNSLVQNSAPGTSVSDRTGRGGNDQAAIFVRGAQPIIAGNTIRDNDAFALSINANSMRWEHVPDWGRATGFVDAYDQYDYNRGPLVRENALDNNKINGMVVRGAILTTDTVWEDTDIVHVLLDEIVVPNHHTFSGLRLESNQYESLVIKAYGEDAGISASGSPLDIDDRIGGTLQVVGVPSFPVVITSLADNTVGAGLTPDGLPQRNTDNGYVGVGELPIGPEVNNGTLIDNDVLVDAVGFFSVRVEAGGNSFLGGMTAQGNSQLFVNANFIFEYLNMIDVGSNGNALLLSQTTITQPPTLTAPDVVESRGQFQGQNGLVQWRVESRIANGSNRFENILTFSSAEPLGNLRYINYLDEDVQFFDDDLMWVVGTPGMPDFRVFTLDGPERVGFSQGGVYLPGPGLVNATYDGWAADAFPLLQSNLLGAGINFNLQGNINTALLTPFLDPELGQVYGLADVTTAFAWSVDPTATSATITSFLETVPRNPAASTAGDWRSLQFDSYANDRNVEVIVEHEPPRASGENDTPSTAQYLGELAPNERSGNEYRRLGFEVYGFIDLTNPRDVDVYSFRAQAGTQVWVDIDLSRHALDAVVEVIRLNPDNGQSELVARSDRSLLGDQDGALRGLPLAADAFDVKDFYSVNPRDPGMRVTLPGAPGLTSEYFIRVRSRPAGDINNLSGGQTTGNYQLNLRLRPVDEKAGSTVRYADIRFATNGIEVLGTPAHSPLLGESSLPLSRANTNLLTAQDIGNLLAADRNTISVGGALFAPTDVNWYKFTVDYQFVQAIAGFNAGGKTWATVFDIDYADGMSRPDTIISVFDELGNLILVGRDSDIADDQPRQVLTDETWGIFHQASGNNLTDLTRGSFGRLDPYVGSVQLPEGENRTYYVAIHSNATLPTALSGQFSTDVENKLVKLEPILGVQRIVEDHIGTIGYRSGTPAEGVQINPTTPAILPVSDPFQLQTHIRPFHLSDVTLYVSKGENTPQLVTVDPFTGRTETTIGSLGTAPQNVRDIVIRSDGQMFGYQELPFPVNNNTAGQLVHIDPGTGQLFVIGQDNIADDADDEDPDDFQTHTVVFGAEALTYRRHSGGFAPFPLAERYRLYYAVDDGPVSRLYRADSWDGDATPKANRPGGVIGRIQAETSFQLIVQLDPEGAVGRSVNGHVQVDETDGEGAVVARIIRTDPLIHDMSINVFSSNPGAADWDTTGFNFIIPAGTREIDLPIDVFDNGLLTGTRSVLLRATGTLLTASQFGGIEIDSIADVMDITDDESASLQLTLNRNTIFEFDNSGFNLHQAQITVTRVGDLSVPAQFTLINPDPTEIIDDPLVFTTHTFAAGQASMSFTIEAVNDGVADGNQTVPLYAFSGAYGSASTTVTVVDVDVPNPAALQLSVSRDTVFEEDIAGFGLHQTDLTVTRFGDITGAASFTLINPDPTEIVDDPLIFTTHTFLPGQASQTFTITSVDDSLNDGDQTVTLFAFSPPYGTAQTQVQVVNNGPIQDPVVPTLSVELAAPTVLEGNAVQATITRTGNLANPLNVNLTSSGPGRANWVAGTQLFLPGQATAVVTITAPNNAIVDGAFLAEMTASAPGFDSISAVLEVIDDDDVQGVAAPALIVELDTATVTEGGTVTATVTRTGPLVAPMAFSLQSSVPGRANWTVGAGLFLPGQETTTLTIVAPDNAVADGVFLVELSASAVGFDSLSDVLAVIDNDVASLTIDIVENFIPEVGGFSLATVTRNTPTDQPLVVTLFNHDFSELQLRNAAGTDIISSVTIPAGQTTATFSVWAVDDGLSDNTQFARVTAAANGFASHSDTVGVQSSATNIGHTTGMAFTKFDGLSLFAPSGSVISDGQTFAVNDATISVTFEFDINGQVTPGNVAVPFTPLMTSSEVGDSIAAAIAGSALNVEVNPGGLGGGSFVIIVGAFGSAVNDSFVTFAGLPNDGYQMYGVSDTGFFYRIDEFTGMARVILNFGATVPFAGLAVGPQNLDLDGDGFGGDLAYTLFAITTNGNLFALDTVDEVARTDVFAGGALSVNTGQNNVTGLAFSTLDFNLWHPTAYEGDAPGHGINSTFDLSRSNYDGGLSYYFGLEDFGNPYVRYPQFTQFGPTVLATQSTQWGVQFNRDQDYMTEYSRQNLAADFYNDLHPDLRDLTVIGNNYNLPGGAHGSLIAAPFSLEGYTSTDKPTLYFNYFLETEGAQATITQDLMRDSARVFASTDGGNTWHMLTTNNSALNSELPRFLSTSSTLGNFDDRQRVQELFDTVADPVTGLEVVFRQARVDLSEFAGASEIVLRFDFATSGDISDPSHPQFSAPLPGDERGNFDHPGRARLNNFRGFYIDDIIVGFAERGEMATGLIDYRELDPDDLPPLGDSTFFEVPRGTALSQPSQVLVGSYQLEIRRGTETQVPMDGRIANNIQIPEWVYDTNDRLATAFIISTGTGLSTADGQTITIFDGTYNPALADGINRVTFEFISTNRLPVGNNVPVFISATHDAAEVANILADTINLVYEGFVAGHRLGVSASSINTSNRVNLYGAADVVGGQELVTPLGPLPTLADFVALPDPSFNWTLNNIIVQPEYTAYVLDVTSGQWRTAPTEVNHDTWRHWVTVIVPNVVTSETAFLWINGGSLTSPPPTTPGGLDADMIDIALRTGTIVVDLPNVPNQSLIFADETRTRSEDAIIAYTFDKYLSTGDDQWPVQLAMVNSAVRTMDAAQQFLLTSPLVAAQVGAPVQVDDFVVSGGSKRGWTTYLTAAVDPRVRAIVPYVFDALNLDQQLLHHGEHYRGDTFLTVEGYSIALVDYIEFGLHTRLSEPEARDLLRIVDPYEYRDSLVMPKYVVQSTGDEFFVLDSSQYYWDELPGPKYLRYVPNTGHGLNQSAADGGKAFYDAILKGTPLPEFTWTMNDDGTISVDLQGATPTAVTLWVGETKRGTNDFRYFEQLGPIFDAFRPTWDDTDMTDFADLMGGVFTVGPGQFFGAEVPANGARAFLVEFTFDSGTDLPFIFTTEISVLRSTPLVVPEFGIHKIENLGDRNLFRDQGQLLIHSNTISDSAEWGIKVAADDREATGGRPHLGSPRNLAVVDFDPLGLAPSVIIENNLIVRSGEGGISFSGETNLVTIPDPNNPGSTITVPGTVGAVPFGKIVNNTIVGGRKVDPNNPASALLPNGVGILVSQNASPTIMNNIVAYHEVGIVIDPTSQSTVLLATAYQNNLSNRQVGTVAENFALEMATSESLFVDAVAGDFHLAAGSRAIDSSVNVLQDRPEMVAVSAPLGIPASPIFAPDLDIRGRLRVDDPNTPPLPGVGGNVFKDRGALERLPDELTPFISVADITVLEGNPGAPQEAVFTVNLSIAPQRGRPVTLNFATVDGSARAGIDYTHVTGTLTFAEGVTSQQVRVPILPNLVRELNRNFRLVLANPVNGQFARSEAIATIIDDDGSRNPALDIDDASVVEGHTGQTPMVFTVRLSAPSTQNVLVDYTTSPITATAGVDYVSTSGTLTIPAGALSGQIVVMVNGDTVREVPDETFRVTLSNARGADIRDGEAIGTIIDDDDTTTYVITIGDVEVIEPDTGTVFANFVVRISAPPQQVIQVDYTTGGGTATPNVDYNPRSGSVIFFPGGPQERTISIQVYGDTIPEANETFFVTLSNPSPSSITIGRAQGRATIIDNDVSPGQAVNATYQLRGNWSTNGEWLDVMVGDFNGDGREDVIGRHAVSGEWWVSLSDATGNTGKNIYWGRWSPTANWTSVMVGDFNGDGRDDVVGRVASTGEWWIMRSNAAGTGSSNLYWGKWSPNVTWTDIRVGDFNGDGKDDVAGRVATSGEWWVARTNFNGAASTNVYWGKWSPNVNWTTVQVGDFNGDGKADLAGRVATTGEWWLARTNTSGLGSTNVLWGKWAPTVSWTNVQVGDFNGDGRADLVGRVSTTGDWWVALANGNGSGTTNQLWTNWATTTTYTDIRVGDFNGDGKSDIVGRAALTGTWRLAQTNPKGVGATNVNYAQLGLTSGWVNTMVGDFNGDGKTQIVSRRQPTGQWYVTAPLALPGGGALAAGGDGASLALGGSLPGDPSAAAPSSNPLAAHNAVMASQLSYGLAELWNGSSDDDDVDTDAIDSVFGRLGDS